jgi:hypothetical protein
MLQLYSHLQVVVLLQLQLTPATSHSQDQLLADPKLSRTWESHASQKLVKLQLRLASQSSQRYIAQLST